MGSSLDLQLQERQGGTQVAQYELSHQRQSHKGDPGVQGLPVPLVPSLSCCGRTRGTCRNGVPWENPAKQPPPQCPFHQPLLKTNLFPRVSLADLLSQPHSPSPGMGWELVQRCCSAFLLRHEIREPEHVPLPAPKTITQISGVKSCPRVVAGMAGPGHGPRLQARTVQPAGVLAAHLFPEDSVSGCRGRNALGSCEDKIKSPLGVTRQRSRKRHSTVCFLGGLFSFFFFSFILFLAAAMAAGRE